jgi:hypothetical protein
MEASVTKRAIQTMGTASVKQPPDYSPEAVERGDRPGAEARVVHEIR